MDIKNQKLLSTALTLSFITILYNLIEGGVSVFFGLSDNTLALLGFGIDSFVEVLSGMAVAHMILRMRYSAVTSRDDVEKFALKVTGISFYILTAGLIAGSILNIFRMLSPVQHFPA